MLAKVSFSFLLCLLLHTIVFGQRYYPYAMGSKEMIGVHAGLTGYFGDLQSKQQFINSTANLGVSYDYLLKNHFSFRAQLSWYQLKASDQNASQPNILNRNLSFSASNFEGSLNALFWLKPNGKSLYSKRSKVNAYGLLGMGLTYYVPKAELNGERYNLRALQTEGQAYSSLAAIFPVGGGITLKVSRNVDIGAEISYRFSTTDYLDDVSTRYLDYEGIEDPVRKQLADRRPELGLDPAAAGSVRGNPQVKDSYAFYSLRVQYRISRAYYRGKNIERKITL